MTKGITHCVILAAGMGTRLGLPEPKPLTPIRGTETILDQQIRHLKAMFGDALNLNIVVGHKAESFRFLDGLATLISNPRYAETNTSKSLLSAFEAIGPGSVLWMNGDVIFRDNVLPLCSHHLEADISFMVVNEADTGDEEVKYTVSETGHIEKIGKKITGSLGEAVGINYVSSEHRLALTQALRDVEDQDYFEEAIQQVIAQGQARFKPVKIPYDDAIEVDTGDDLSQALNRFSTS